MLMTALNVPALVTQSSMAVNETAGSPEEPCVVCCTTPRPDTVNTEPRRFRSTSKRRLCMGIAVAVPVVSAPPPPPARRVDGASATGPPPPARRVKRGGWPRQWAQPHASHVLRAVSSPPLVKARAITAPKALPQPRQAPLARIALFARIVVLYKGLIVLVDAVVGQVHVPVADRLRRVRLDVHEQHKGDDGVLHLKYYHLRPTTKTKEFVARILRLKPSMSMMMIRKIPR